MIHNKQFGLVFTALNEARECIVFIIGFIFHLQMDIQYTVCDGELPYPVKFTYTVNAQYLIWGLIP